MPEGEEETEDADEGRSDLHEMDHADSISQEAHMAVSKVTPARHPDAWSYTAPANGTIVNDAAAVEIKGAPGPEFCNYLTGLQISTDTLGAATELIVRDGDATVLWRHKLQTTALPLAVVNFSQPLVGARNQKLEVLTAGAVTGGVYVSAQGYVDT